MSDSGGRRPRPYFGPGIVPAEKPRGIARDDCPGRYIFCNHAACADGGSFADGHSAKDCRSGPDGSAAFNECPDALPIRLGLQFTRGGGGPRKPIVDEGDIMADKNFVLDRDAFADERVAGNFAALADPNPFLNLDKRADFRVVADFAAVQVGEGENPDPLAKFNVWSDALIWRCGILHAGTIVRPWPLVSCSLAA